MFLLFSCPKLEIGIMFDTYYGIYCITGVGESIYVGCLPIFFSFNGRFLMFEEMHELEGLGLKSPGGSFTHIYT